MENPQHLWAEPVSVFNHIHRKKCFFLIFVW